MNSLTKHEEYARKNIEDRTAWRALVDHHEELLNLPHRVALRAVATMRFNSRRAAELQRAVEAIKGHSARAESIKDAVRACCADDVAWAAKIIVRAGRGRPVFYLANDGNGRAIASAHCILVGARFVLLLSRLRREMMSVESEVHANVSTYLFNV